MKLLVLFGQKSGQHLSPSSFGVSAGQDLVRHGRVANHENGYCWFVGLECRKDQKQGQQQNQFVFHIILFLQFLGSYLFGRGRFQPSPASRFRDTCTARERHLYGSRATQVWNTSRASVAHIPRQKASEGGLEPYFCASEGVHVRHWLKMWFQSVYLTASSLVSIFTQPTRREVSAPGPRLPYSP